MIILVNTDIAKLDVDAALSQLSEQRRQRVLAMSNVGVQRQSIASYLLLCDALRQYGCQLCEPPVFSYTNTGKPLLRDLPHLHFSMSHTRDAVAVVVADKPVGIDIECPERRVTPALIAHTMSITERQTIDSSIDAQLAFFELWTRKEAYLKLTGEGIRGDMRTTLENASDVNFITQRYKHYVVTVAAL